MPALLKMRVLPLDYFRIIIFCCNMHSYVNACHLRSHVDNRFSELQCYIPFCFPSWINEWKPKFKCRSKKHKHRRCLERWICSASLLHRNSWRSGAQPSAATTLSETRWRHSPARAWDTALCRGGMQRFLMHCQFWISIHGLYFPINTNTQVKLKPFIYTFFLNKWIT